MVGSHYWRLIRFGRGRRGVTLIELLVAIAIAAILTGVVLFTLRASLDIYNVAQEELALQKEIDTAMDEVTTGGFDNYGIKDALRILEAGEHSIKFVPLWFDESRNAVIQNKPVTLDRPLKAGAALPIVEADVPGEEGYRLVPITFISGEHTDPLKPDDKIILNEPLPPGSRIKSIYHPDTTYFPSSAMTITWDKESGELKRVYKNASLTIPAKNTPGTALKNMTLRYFDNANTGIPIGSSGKVSENLLVSVTAIKVTLEAATERMSREKSAFINFRGSRTSGLGIIFREGTRIKIPNSREIRALSLTNLTGVKEDGHIHIEAHPDKGQAWRLHIELGVEDGHALITTYTVEYPPGQAVYSKAVNMTTDIPLNFLTLDSSGYYDYDFDSEHDVVNVEGNVELVVTKMERVDGGALFIRP